MLTAFDLFSEHGIKNVSMDDIAHNMSVSKRTLYELFEDKETLLTECISLNVWRQSAIIADKSATYSFRRDTFDSP